MTPQRRQVAWLPDRGEVIWINHNPQAGREMKDHHPFLVLSTAPFHAAVGLVVGCAMTSAAYNQGSSLAVNLGPIANRPEAHLRALSSDQILRLEGPWCPAPSAGCPQRRAARAGAVDRGADPGLPDLKGRDRPPAARGVRTVSCTGLVDLPWTPFPIQLPGQTWRRQ